MRLLTLALTFSLSACGGAIDTGLLDGGGTDGSPKNDATSDGSPKTDGSPNPDGSTPPTCDDLVNKLNTEQAAATQCCATCNSVQCTEQVDGLCCPLTVNDSSSSAVQAYESTLEQIKNSKCAINCPAITCSTKPTGMCGQSGTCAQ